MSFDNTSNLLSIQQQQLMAGVGADAVAGGATQLLKQFTSIRPAGAQPSLENNGQTFEI